jgi:hypothetical protein
MTAHGHGSVARSSHCSFHLGDDGSLALDLFLLTIPATCNLTLGEIRDISIAHCLWHLLCGYRSCTTLVTMIRRC